jgi:hypothetical protein
MRYLIAALLIFTALPALAQTATPTPTPFNTPRPSGSSDCGNGLPCGPIPWPLPAYVGLSSPTVFPTIVVTATRTPTPLPGVTAGPTSVPGASPTFELDGVGDQLATLEGIMNATTIPIEGGFSAEQLGTDAGQFFGTLKGVSEIHLGPFTPLLVFFFLAFIFVMGIQASGLIVPLVLAIFGFIRRLVSTILDFLPL